MMSTLAIVLLAIAPSAGAEACPIATFERCFDGCVKSVKKCERLELHDGNRFVYLGSRGETTGKCERLAPHLVRLTSDGSQAVSILMASTEADRARSQLRIVATTDDEKSLLPGVTVVFWCEDGTAKVNVTRAQGEARIDGCNATSIEASLPGMVELQTTELEPGLNMFWVFLPERKFLLDGEVWLLHEDRAIQVELEYALRRKPDDV
jgi:hypothetical protein